MKETNQELAMSFHSDVLPNIIHISIHTACSSSIVSLLLFQCTFIFFILYRTLFLYQFQNTPFSCNYIINFLMSKIIITHSITRQKSKVLYFQFREVITLSNPLTFIHIYYLSQSLNQSSSVHLWSNLWKLSINLHMLSAHNINKKTPTE